MSTLIRRIPIVAVLCWAKLLTAQDFSASILVDRTTGPAPLLVSIDMCSSTGRELRFGWDYDGDGIDDQRGPCRRTVTLERAGHHPIRVSVWEAVSADRNRREETVWATVTTSDPCRDAPPFFGFRLTATKDPAWVTVTAVPLWGHEHGQTGTLEPVPAACRAEILGALTWYEDIRRQPTGGAQGHVDASDPYRYLIRTGTFGEVRLCSSETGRCGDWVLNDR